jgi:hypothetical protein
MDFEVYLLGSSFLNRGRMFRSESEIIPFLIISCGPGADQGTCTANQRNEREAQEDSLGWQETRDAKGKTRS